ncbi:MarR family winged helix-turn-helix transcriptional regulator [Lysobacter sp. LF1]|uniref:MarR family winged helix-turn-helix transcriptional regulator n=1 Tax=Lysobacter stagni TaxID=3045172 RepID=A0ABT6XFM4_9GAMM|nr:MarR family winged helix-turn-helix transcriptional regulator [Lysobacter sp. LF1]MDI9238685.1 MarR family winged helix-turn-helix transcriptional regulator [Lysobacter sp. LF1]
MNARDPGVSRLGQPLPGHAQLDLEHFLPYRLSVLSNRVSSTIARIYTERFQLSITEWRVMAVLGRYPGLSANEVAQRTAMDKVAVSRAVARLLEAGRLERDIHGDDRRRSVLKLSEAGYRIYDEVAPMALAFERRLLDGIDDAERAVLFRLLDRLDELELRAEAEAPT